MSKKKIMSFRVGTDDSCLSSKRLNLSFFESIYCIHWASVVIVLKHCLKWLKSRIRWLELAQKNYFNQWDLSETPYLPSKKLPTWESFTMATNSVNLVSSNGVLTQDKFKFLSYRLLIIKTQSTQVMPWSPAKTFLIHSLGKSFQKICKLLKESKNF